ncbi:DUF3995 domain-containing protein [Sorangium sp. So ce315]|uniref:DUF3995 domain-containing protein n=1 Tax=Sorangium sp. So ce315 TaxID=3133299 RepID=UPI003F60BB77
MDPLLSSATVVAGVTAALHAIVDGPSVVPPLHRGQVETLYSPLALLCAPRGAGGAAGWGDVLAWASSAVLAALAAVHVYWGLGGGWPGDARHEKVEVVVGLPKGSPFPSLSQCLLVAFLLASSAALVLAQRYGRDVLPASALRGGVWAVVLVLGARGVGGFFDARLRPATRALPYDRLNRLVYSPLSLALAAAVAGAALD